MSLSSSLFTGTSGLTNMGNAMQVIGNNIANVNTVGFKKGRTTFADTLNQSVATQSGTAQVGRGMNIGSVDQNFEQGSFESTGNTTDLSIGGEGFFVLRQATSDTNYYTRSGNFYFDRTGQLINPQGYIVQGWELDDETGDDIGSIGDIVLDAFTSPPKQSSRMTTITNLDADAISKSVVLSNLWDSSSETYVEPSGFEYQTVVKVYDSLGTTHDVSIYYDKIDGSKWEYIITCNPDEDQRNLVQDTDSLGLLARGTITFSPGSGDILDFTMSEFTGRIGNVQANGVNSEDEITFTIQNTEPMSLDGYGFSLEFNGENWEFQDVNLDGTVDADDKPANYQNARIIYSDDQNIEIALSPDLTGGAEITADIKIKLDTAAVATDSLSFDINDPKELHVQGISNTTYAGDTENDNTSLIINDPSVMTEDSEGVRIIWYPVDEKWRWSNPEGAYSAGTLVSGMSATAPAAEIDTTTDTVVVTNYEDMPRNSEDVTLRYDQGTGTWDWYDTLKEEDFTSQVFTFTPTNNPEMTIESLDGFRTIATGASTLDWDEVTSTWSATPAAGGLTIDIDPVESDDRTVRFTMYYAGSTANTATIEYNFGSGMSTAASQSISFNLDPSPPEEYPNAAILSTASTDSIHIDFDGDSTIDLTFNVTSGTATSAMADGSVFIFDVDPNVPPEEYPDAVLVGDYDKAYIDLDGSGTDEDREDIVLEFAESLKRGAQADQYDDRSEIAFDIKGSTAWREVSTEEIRRTGYFSFNADFLGGDEGSTEMQVELDIGTRYDGLNFVNDALTSTQYSRSSTTTFQNADGYSAGDLQGVDVSGDGVITGIYSNGQLIPLFRVGLARFQNNQGLNNVGGNLFSETRDSGDAITNRPGENGLGTISPNSLEMSNVDIAQEFVSMITTQRGFQANSKTITTVDDMMSTVIQMKR